MEGADEATLRFYRENASAYAEREITSRRLRLGRFLAPLSPGAAILELGCGAGFDTAEMLALGFDVSATDGSPEMAAEAPRRLGRPVGTLLFGDLDAVEAYDGVWANACLLHVPRADLPQILQLIWRALKPGGILIVNTPKGRQAYSGNHVKLATADVTHLAEQAGLKRGIVNTGIIGALAKALPIVPLSKLLAAIP